MDNIPQLDDLVRRWQSAAVRAQEEGVRVLCIGGEYYASSTSHPLGSYHLRHSDEGWICACQANADYGMPCKHIAALAAVLSIDLVADVRLVWPPLACHEQAA
jgi:hypothetical protein